MLLIISEKIGNKKEACPRNQHPVYQALKTKHLYNLRKSLSYGKTQY